MQAKKIQLTFSDFRVVGDPYSGKVVPRYTKIQKMTRVRTSESGGAFAIARILKQRNQTQNLRLNSKKRLKGNCPRGTSTYKIHFDLLLLLILIT